MEGHEYGAVASWRRTLTQTSRKPSLQIPKPALRGWRSAASQPAPLGHTAPCGRWEGLPLALCRTRPMQPNGADLLQRVILILRGRRA